MIDHEFHRALRIVGQKAFDHFYANTACKAAPSLKVFALEMFLKNLSERDTDRFLKILLRADADRDLDPPIGNLAHVPFLSIAPLLSEHTYVVSTDESSKDYLDLHATILGSLCYQCELRYIPLYCNFCLHCSSKCPTFCTCAPCRACLKDIEVFKDFISASIIHPYCRFVRDFKTKRYSSWHDPLVFGI